MAPCNECYHRSSADLFACIAPGRKFSQRSFRSDLFQGLFLITKLSISFISNLLSFTLSLLGGDAGNQNLQFLRLFVTKHCSERKHYWSNGNSTKITTSPPFTPAHTHTHICAHALYHTPSFAMEKFEVMLPRGGETRLARFPSYSLASISASCAHFALHMLYVTQFSRFFFSSFLWEMLLTGNNIIVITARVLIMFKQQSLRVPLPRSWKPTRP